MDSWSLGASVDRERARFGVDPGGSGAEMFLLVGRAPMVKGLMCVRERVFLFLFFFFGGGGGGGGKCCFKISMDIGKVEGIRFRV